MDARRCYLSYGIGLPFMVGQPILSTLKRRSCHTILVPLFLALTTACASTGASQVDYVEPFSTNVQNERIIQRPFFETWDIFIAQLRKSFFVINNVQQASRLITLTFSSGFPAEFIDCGIVRRTLQNGEVAEKLVYQVAQGNIYRFASNWGDDNRLRAAHLVQRRTELNGTADVYLEPNDEKTTRATVNVRYTFTVRSGEKIEFKNRLGHVLRSQEKAPVTNTVTFTTLQGGISNFEGPELSAAIKCTSVGTLESKILSMAGR